MAAFGIITLFLTAFMMIFYGYLAKHTDHDVSFFFAVGIISIIMNLATNAAGIYVLAWLYLVLALLFIGLGFVVSFHGSLGFYTSIGPWFMSLAKDVKLTGWKALSLIVFPAGGVLYFVWYKSKPELAAVCGKNCLWGILLWAFLLWMILGVVL